MKSIIKVLIIGAGQIGSRHLQGAIKSNNNLSITVVDPSINSLELTKKRAKDVVPGNSETVVEYTAQIPSNVHYKICIISTNANVRAKVTQELLAKCTIEHIIFEKVLFQKEVDFDVVSKLLTEKKIIAWVNCPRRTHPGYQKIAKDLNKDLKIDISVNGASWGMACNSIHFIDLFSFLTNNTELIIKNTDLNRNITKSKRGGNFYEINGLIEIKAGIHSLKISCSSDKSFFLKVKINNKNTEYDVDEVNGIWKKSVEKVVENTHQPFAFQSNMTNKLIDNLINNNKCELTSYEESHKHHLPLIFLIRKHISETLETQLLECPIT